MALPLGDAPYLDASSTHRSHYTTVISSCSYQQSVLHRRRYTPPPSAWRLPSPSSTASLGVPLADQGGQVAGLDVVVLQAGVFAVQVERPQPQHTGVVEGQEALAVAGGLG